jgi:hypothetical protein
VPIGKRRYEREAIGSIAVAKAARLLLRKEGIFADAVRNGTKRRSMRAAWTHD